VKGDIVQGRAMHLGLRLRDTRKNIQRPLLCALADAGSLYYAADFLPGIVGVFAAVARGVFGVMPVRVAMRVFMLVIVCMVVTVISLIVVGVVVTPAFQNDKGPGSTYAAPPVADKIQLPASKPQLGKLRAQDGGVNAQVDKRAQGHVAGNSCRAVKM
jgi:hypothetical protein